jgi:hypothetical protein
MMGKQNAILQREQGDAKLTNHDPARAANGETGSCSEDL